MFLAHPKVTPPSDAFFMGGIRKSFLKATKTFLTAGLSVYKKIENVFVHMKVILVFWENDFSTPKSHPSVRRVCHG